MSNRCEDYPCCGHTDGLGCNYTPDMGFIRAHVDCEHEHGFCYVDDEETCDPHNSVCAYDDDDCEICAEYWLEFHAEALGER